MVRSICLAPWFAVTATCICVAENRTLTIIEKLEGVLMISEDVQQTSRFSVITEITELYRGSVRIHRKDLMLANSSIRWNSGITEPMRSEIRKIAVYFRSVLSHRFKLLIGQCRRILRAASRGRIDSELKRSMCWTGASYSQTDVLHSRCINPCARSILRACTCTDRKIARSRDREIASGLDLQLKSSSKSRSGKRSTEMRWIDSPYYPLSLLNALYFRAMENKSRYKQLRAK